MGGRCLLAFAWAGERHHLPRSCHWVQAPSEALACPSTSLCTLADGHAEEPGPGGRMYYATSLDGAWNEAFEPTYGVDAISCASTL